MGSCIGCCSDVSGDEGYGKSKFGADVPITDAIVFCPNALARVEYETTAQVALESVM